METILISIFGTFGIGIITAVFAFSRERLNKADDQLEKAQADSRWYRDKLLPALERQQDILEALERDRRNDSH